MTDQRKSEQATVSGDPAGARSTKKPYVKPAFRREQVFETMALACGKQSGTQLACKINRKSS